MTDHTEVTVVPLSTNADAPQEALEHAATIKWLRKDADLPSDVKLDIHLLSAALTPAMFGTILYQTDDDHFSIVGVYDGAHVLELLEAALGSPEAAKSELTAIVQLGSKPFAPKLVRSYTGPGSPQFAEERAHAVMTPEEDAALRARIGLAPTGPLTQQAFLELRKLVVERDLSAIRFCVQHQQELEAALTRFAQENPIALSPQAFTDKQLAVELVQCMDSFLLGARASGEELPTALRLMRDFVNEAAARLAGKKEARA